MIKKYFGKKWMKVLCCVLFITLVTTASAMMLTYLQHSIEYLNESCSFCECDAIYAFPAASCEEAYFCHNCFSKQLLENPDDLYRLYTAATRHGAV